MGSQRDGHNLVTKQRKEQPSFQIYFPQIHLIQNLAKLADGKLSSLLISFVPYISDLMIIGVAVWLYVPFM